MSDRASVVRQDLTPRHLGPAAWTQVAGCDDRMAVALFNARRPGYTEGTARRLLRRHPRPYGRVLAMYIGGGVLLLIIVILLLILLF
jgi:hypothetical protein